MGIKKITDIKEAAKHLTLEPFSYNKVHPLFFLSNENMEKVAESFKHSFNNMIETDEDLLKDNVSKNKFVELVMNIEERIYEARKKQVNIAIENYPSEAKMIIDEELNTNRAYEYSVSEDFVKDAIDNIGNRFCNNNNFKTQFKNIDKAFEL